MHKNYTLEDIVGTIVLVVDFVRLTLSEPQ